MASPKIETIFVRENITAKVLVKGEGKPLVFLHGAGGNNWDSYLEELSKQYKVYAPYMPGTGGSTGNEELQGWWDLVLYYYELFDALGLEQVDVIGHSFGGMLAAEIASTDPKRVKNLLLIAAVGLWIDQTPVTDVFSLVNTPDELLAKMFVDVNSDAAKAFSTLPEDPKERVEAIVENLTALTEAGRYMWPIPDKGLSRRIHRLTANTCIVWGEKDALVPVEYAYEYQRKIPGATVKIIENTSHYPQAEKLEEVLNATIDFLSLATVTK
ncbi:alpha/beta fold hydrolase [Neobacillus muris]|uniref:alpha/beta fold hydrolase n=1 Tax=Neobacillus muris TaxID=2941334 RepID=UPI00203B203B|nr:alpha/beta hydrolase [Neobacillus muris]